MVPSSDPVHGVENILPLHVHRKPARLADGAKMLREHIERHFALGKIDEHDHCEVALHERLADVENVDVCSASAAVMYAVIPLASRANTDTMAFMGVPLLFQ